MSATSSVPIPEGTYECRVVPDTVDLAHCAELAINAITRGVDPQRDYDTYLRGNIVLNPPRLQRSWESTQGKLAEPLVLNRLMTGNRANVEVDAAWIGWLHGLADGVTHLHPVYIGRGLSAIALYHRLTQDSGWLDTGHRVVDQVV